MDLSRIFVLVYQAAGEQFSEPFFDTEKSISGYHEYKGHSFKDVQYRSPKMCDACKKSLWSAFQPPSAVKCAHCNTRVHKDHCFNDDWVVEPCDRIRNVEHADGSNLKSLLLVAESPDMKEAWISHIFGKANKVVHL